MNQKKLLAFILLNFTLAFSFFAQDRDIPKRGYAIDWIMPKAMANPLIAQFDHLELGVNLQDASEIQVLIFI